jgi:TonB family protein
LGTKFTPPSVRYRVDLEVGSDAVDGAEEVILSRVVDTNGKPGEIRVVKSSGQAVHEKGVEALTKWEFDPRIQNGVPVKVQATSKFTSDGYDQCVCLAKCWRSMPGSKR